MNKIAVLLLVLTAAIGVPHTALAQQNALTTFKVNAASRLETCNDMYYGAYLAEKWSMMPKDQAQQRLDRAETCIATAKTNTNLEYQAALKLVKNNPKYVHHLNIYHTYWLSAIRGSINKDDITINKRKLEQLAKPLKSKPLKSGQ
jgi:hypothetical protein